MTAPKLGGLRPEDSGIWTLNTLNGRNFELFLLFGVIFIFWNFGHVFISGFPFFFESFTWWPFQTQPRKRPEQPRWSSRINDYQEVYRERVTWLLRGGFAQVLRHFPKWIWCLAEASIDLEKRERGTHGIRWILVFHEKFTWASKMDTVQIYLIHLGTTFPVACFRHLRMESDLFSQAGSWGHKRKQGQQRFRNPQRIRSSSSGGVLVGRRSLWRSHSPRLTLKHDWMPLSPRRHGVVSSGMLWPEEKLEIS